jgi:outer membrane protein assembly factor BamA
MPWKETLESLRLEACVSQAARVKQVNHITPQNRARASRLLIVVGCFVAFTAAQPAAQAQERTTLRRVEIIGLQHLSADQVIASTGLRVGDLVDARGIDTAAAKLMNTGWFKSVNYRVQTADSDTTVVFEVAEKATTSPVTATTDVLGSVSWSGNRALTNQELTNAFALRPGDVAIRLKIDQGIDAVRKAYARNGYINAAVVESNTRDANRSLNYQFTISEGGQYRMGALTITGLTPADTRNLKSKWTLTSGAVYDDSYSDQYRTSVLRPFVASLAQRTGVRSKYEISTKPDIQKQTVDVIITFR